MSSTYHPQRSAATQHDRAVQLSHDPSRGGDNPSAVKVTMAAPGRSTHVGFQPARGIGGEQVVPRRSIANDTGE